MKKILVLLLCCFSFTVRAEGLIDNVFLNINENYVEQMNNKDIALKGLSCLQEVDKNIKIEENEENIVLYQKDKIVKFFEKPKDQDPKTWADLVHQIIKESINVSEKLDVLDFELEDRFASKVFEGMDGYSKYFGAFDEEKPVKVRRNFASRIVDGFLLIRVLRFQKGVSERIKESVEECSKCKGLILDLRSNQGGFLNEAINTANLFLDEGIITYTQASPEAAPQYYTADKGDILGLKPMVVLIDGQTASAAEVLAAALSEQNRAVLIGTKTYGKGAVQDVQRMDKDRAMSVTSSFFYTPSGLNINKKGLTPFICASSDESCERQDRFDKEEDIDRAVQYLKTGM